MALATYAFRRGETIRIALDAMSGAPDDVSAISAALRPLGPGQAALSQNAQGVAFAVTSRDASGDIPAGWTLVLDESESALLAAGNYLADARLTIGSDVMTTEPVMIRITEPATLA